VLTAESPHEAPKQLSSKDYTMPYCVRVEQENNVMKTIHAEHIAIMNLKSVDDDKNKSITVPKIIFPKINPSTPKPHTSCNSSNNY